MVLSGVQFLVRKLRSHIKPLHIVAEQTKQKTKRNRKGKKQTNKQTTTTAKKKKNPKLRETPPRRISSASEKCQIFRDGF